VGERIGWCGVDLPGRDHSWVLVDVYVRGKYTSGAHQLRGQANMTLQEITAKMKEGAAKKSSFGSTVKFSTDQGVVYIDGNANPPTVSNDDKAADCTLKMTLDDFGDMISGKLDGMSAFMTGKLKIEGDMGVAMKLQSILR
jgi:putative sterol carrier protein